MDGVFMKKYIKRTMIFLVMISIILGIVALYKDFQYIKKNVIRLHVVANSDAPQDQSLKLQVKDYVVEKLQPIISEFYNKDQAEKYIKENLSFIKQISQDALAAFGSNESISVTFGKEAFDTRVYDTFSLPSGIYDSLRIEIGDGEGKNWWCVIFPSLCLPATANDFKTVSTSSGFSDGLTNTLQRSDGYEIRFFILDCFGKLENIFR